MKTPLTSFENRLTRIGVDAALFNTSDAVSSINLRYLSGFTGSDAAILITPKERHLFTDGRYKTQAPQQARNFNVHVVRNKMDALGRMIKSLSIETLAVEGPRLSFQFTSELIKRVPDLKLVGLSRELLENFRICKTIEEKELIQKAAEIASSACKKTIEKLIDRKESEVAAELESNFRKLDSEGPGFETIVASGPRSALPHGTASDKVIVEGELVVIDYGCRYHGYRSDETVTCVTSKPTSEQKKIHAAVRDAHDKAMEACKEGVHVKKIDSIARESIEKSGYGKYFLHSLGHGLGLETHEPPYLSQKGRGILKEGMVFTIEPGIYIENFGGVRLESLVYLDHSGPEILSKMPKELIIVT